MTQPEPVVIDTHAVIWWVLDNPQLSATAAERMREAIDAGQPLYVSAYSLLELRYASEKPRDRKILVGGCSTTGAGSQRCLAVMIYELERYLVVGSTRPERGPGEALRIRRARFRNCVTPPRNGSVTGAGVGRQHAVRGELGSPHVSFGQ